MRTVPHDIATTKRFRPTSRDTAAAVGNAGVEAVATVAMILWIEATCGELMAPYFESGEAGVGIRVAVDHTGPAFAGRSVEVGLGPRPVADVVADARYKAAVAENTDDAIARGVFGVPSFILQDRLFFGSDRMDRLDEILGQDLLPGSFHATV